MKHKVIINKNLGNAFILTVERNGIEFKAGQHVELSIVGSPYKRPYSIYSGEKEDFLEFLIKEIPNGDTSPMLRKLLPRDYIELGNPEGNFTVEQEDLNKEFFLICTGTGIAPFHSFVKTYHNLNYLIVHGISTKQDKYEENTYEMFRYVPCISKDPMVTFNKRVTDFMQGYKKANINALYYLCGKGQMIYDVDKLLTENGVPSKNILWEVYHAERI